jgi:hypothetical protein
MALLPPAALTVLLLIFLNQKMLAYKECKYGIWKHSGHKRPANHHSVNVGEKVKTEVEELCISKCFGSLNSHFSPQSHYITVICIATA